MGGNYHTVESQAWGQGQQVHGAGCERTHEALYLQLMCVILKAVSRCPRCCSLQRRVPLWVCRTEGLVLYAPPKKHIHPAADRSPPPLSLLTLTVLLNGPCFWLFALPCAVLCRGRPHLACAVLKSVPFTPNLRIQLQPPPPPPRAFFSQFDCASDWSLLLGSLSLLLQRSGHTLCALY